MIRGILLGAFIGPLLGSTCGSDGDVLLPARDSSGSATGELLARIIHVSDTHILDPHSPARFAGAQILIPSAWRAWESTSTQLLDGIIRTSNRLHASERPVGFLVHTGDACDNVQGNELAWFLQVMDGGRVSPLSAPDDRPPGTVPPPGLDPYAAFDAQGLYRRGIHGDQSSIPWYVAFGNHDVFGLGVFPIVTQEDGSAVTPLPLAGRPGLLLPTVLNPVGAWTHGPVSPAFPGPPPLLDWPMWVSPVPERAYFSKEAFIEAMFTTLTGPVGHGFASPRGPSWYSTSPAPGIRLITLDTCDQQAPQPGWPNHEGCIAHAQRAFLEAELTAADQRDEWVVIASHHPSHSLEPLYGSVVGPQDLRDLLNACPRVILHLAGHTHRNRAFDRGGYIELETCSTLDWPQEARLVEIWRDAAGEILIHYEMFSGIEADLPPLGDDPLRGLREQARSLARPDKRGQNMQRPLQAVDPEPEGRPGDREGAWQRWFSTPPPRGR